MHSVRGAVHGISVEIEPAHSDGLWADLRQLCEDGGWDLSRLQMAWAKGQRAQGQKSSSVSGEAAQSWRPGDGQREPLTVQEAQGSGQEDPAMRAAAGFGLDDMDNIDDQSFGEANL